jgi:hypothetical protein
MGVQAAKLTLFEVAKSQHSTVFTGVELMSKYHLNINLEKSDLDAIYAAKQHVIIVKHTAERKSAVAWVSFTPFEHNTVLPKSFFDCL